MPERARVIEQRDGRDLLVLGTKQIIHAKDHLPADVERWGGSHPAHWVRRRGSWHSRSDLVPLPKDARPGVLFAGVVRKSQAG